MTDSVTVVQVVRSDPFSRPFHVSAFGVAVERGKILDRRVAEGVETAEVADGSGLDPRFQLVPRPSSSADRSDEDGTFRG